MGYQALLFCPDEKTARTVTQVLSELEFSVESCIEPFAAVKKLMGQHFDAVVVDCDNEQNATLLFKSARNSTSNQASLAVAVVEGQAGVAKAFRIGANLVLTKPINIEQAKGTLRVARGLLRKGDPAKPAAPAAAGIPAKSFPAKTVPPLKSATPPPPAVVSTLLPDVPPEVKAPATAAWPATVAASSKPAPAPATNDDDLLEIGVDDPVTASSPAAIVESAFGKILGPDPQPAKLSPAVVSSAAEVMPASNATWSAAHGSGAASAPAPARETRDSHVAGISPFRTTGPTEPIFDQPAAVTAAESRTYAGPEPSFTFGGANVPEKSAGGSKKIILGVAAATIVAAGLYAGWTKFQGKSSEPAAEIQTAATPVAVSPITKPSANQPAAAAPKTLASTPATSAPTTSASSSVSSANSHLDAAPLKTPAASKKDSAFGDDVTVTNFANEGSASAGKSETAPLVLKGGRVPAHAKPTAPDAPAPSMIGIASASESAPPPSLGSGEGSAPQPVLQTLNVSQGVSQGLLLKKVQPTYPRNAITMRIEGSVELMATISKTGDISHVKVLSGDSQLSRAASDAVKQWKYKPYLLNGEPVEIQTQVTINFKLPK